MFSLLIAIKAADGTIYDSVGDCENATMLSSLYDTLATDLQAKLRAAGTYAPKEQVVDGNQIFLRPISPKITLVQSTTTFFDDVNDFAQAIWKPRSV